MTHVSLTVNRRRYQSEVEDRTLLVHYIREVLGLTGTHIGCDTSQCGACTVLLNGHAIKSCTMFAVQADGTRISTVEGLALGDALHPIQEAFREEHGLQCGFCTPGMLMTLTEFLRRNPSPTDDEVRHALAGNLCRCTGYQNIVNAALLAARTMREARGAREAVRR